MRLPAHLLPALPGALTLGGLALGLAGVQHLADGEIAPALVLLTVGQGCDIADGAVARKLGAVTRGGAVLDLACDRVLAVATLAVVGLWWALAPLALWQAWGQYADRRISGRWIAALVAASEVL